jgi:hypothetical protein
VNQREKGELPPLPAIAPTLTGPGTEVVWQGPSAAGAEITVTLVCNQYAGAAPFYVVQSSRNWRAWRATPFVERAEYLRHCLVADRMDVAGGPRGTTWVQIRSGAALGGGQDDDRPATQREPRGA